MGANIVMLTVLDRRFCLTWIFPFRMYVNPGSLSVAQTEPSFADKRHALT